MKKYYIAAIATFLFIPIITIGAELIPPLKDFLKLYFWHHWLGKGVLLIVLFMLLSLIFKFADKKEMESEHEKYLLWIFILALGGSLAIFIFFVLEYLKLL